MSNSSLPLSGKVALVTGACRGIGKGIALELASLGSAVTLTYVSQSGEPLVNEICQTIESLPHKPRTYALRVDLSTIDEAQLLIRSLADWTENKLKIDILVNNAAVEFYNLNVRGTMLLTQAILPYLNDNGRIVNIGSVGARKGFKDLGLYCCSKAALEGLTRVWAAELGGNGTTANCVEPGPIQSDMLENIPKDIVALQKALTPIGNRLGTVPEVASIDGAWITGQSISATGGYAMY
ncbi:NAD(P)-binding protein [Hypoxylon sp. FL0543]|nr:NAD(P)-binding protein [Hypoxylon sp. FL0543]